MTSLASSKSVGMIPVGTVTPVESTKVHSSVIHNEYHYISVYTDTGAEALSNVFDSSATVEMTGVSENPVQVVHAASMLKQLNGQLSTT
jgi:hypothetical protein